MSIQYTGGVQYIGEYHEYSRGDTMMSVGDIMSTLGEGGSVHLGDTMMSVGDIMSTPGDFQYTGVFIQIQLFFQ